MLGIPWASAQSLMQIPPPHAPFVAPMPDRGQWTITLDYSELEKSSTAGTSAASPKNGDPLLAHSLQQIQTVKTGHLKRDILINRDGTTTEIWYVDGENILSPGPSGDICVSDNKTFEPDSSVKGIFRKIGNLTISFGFPGCDWLNLKYYDKVSTDGTAPSYHYILQEGGVVAAEAWIDTKTYLPIKYASGQVNYIYAFGGTPSEDLVLPPAYLAAYKKLHQMQAYSSQLTKDAAKTMHP